MRLNPRERELIFSYLAMRRMIGILAIALPFVVVLGGFAQGGIEIQPSISGYYYTNMRDFFVGINCAVALFLISYKGYELIDDVVTNLSGIFALGIVAFPTSMFSRRIVRVGIFMIPDNISQYIHLVFAALFLLLLAVNSIFLFTRHGGAPSREKKIRNTLYVLCGWVTICCVIFMVTYIAFYSHSWISKFYPLFVSETIAIVSFGISWLVKGNTLFKDKSALK